MYLDKPLAGHNLMQAIARVVFEQGNDFARKITYRTSDDTEALIKGFRIDSFPRIAVTVDMIATGTDIKPVECLIFMRNVKSEGYFEQMKGTLSDAELRQVTPDAQTKTRFVLIDAVGVTENQKTISQPLERKRNIPFDKLIDQIAQGRRDFDAISSLAGRLAALDRQSLELDLHRGHAVDEQDHVVPVMTVVGTDAQLVDHLETVLTPVSDVDQCVGQGVCRHPVQSCCTRAAYGRL